MNPTADELMTLLGFDRLGDSPERDGTVMWLLSYGARDLLVVLPEKATLKDVAECIYDAGARDKRDEIGGEWNDFLKSVRLPTVNTVWQRARELQKDKHEATRDAGSMPHPRDMHADGSPDPL